MVILYKLAIRLRKEKFFAALNNIIDLSASPDFHILVSMDEDDEVMTSNEVLEAISGNPKYHMVKVVIGQSKSKIEAINHAVNDFKLPYDILVNISDDQTFLVKGFDNIVRNAMKEHFPDLDGFLHFPDQVCGDKLCTLSIMGRVYFSRTNYIYHPAYRSLFCDDEATQVAKILNRYAFIDKAIFEHRHVAWGFGTKDKLMIRNEKLWNKDQHTFNQRKAKNFDL